MSRQKILLCVLCVFALFNGVKWAVQFQKTPYQPLDFRTYYLGSKAYFKQTNPYADSSQAQLWKTACNTENVWTKKTGFPHAVVVYAPQFVWFFACYNLLDFPVAKWLQFFLNLCAIGLIVFCIKKLQESLSYLLIISVVLAFRGTWYALDTGQPMIQVLALCIFAIYLLEKRELKILPAFILAFVSFKFTLLIPIIIYMLCAKKTSTLFSYFSLVLILNTVALIFTPAPLELLHTWRHNIHDLWEYTHSFHMLNGLNMISSSLSVALNYFINIPHALIQGINLIFLVSGYGFSIYIGMRRSPKAAMILACLTGLCFGHHLVYDLLAFIVLMLILKDSGIVNHLVFYLLAAVMVLPLGSLGRSLLIPALDFAVPLTLFTYWCFIMLYYLRNKNSVIKNPS